MRSVDPLNLDRDIIDKPIQWVAGMMEVEEDPLSKIKTMEKIIYDQEKRRDNNFEIDVVKRILQRGPRGAFQGHMGNRQ